MSDNTSPHRSQSKKKAPAESNQKAAPVEDSTAVERTREQFQDVPVHLPFLKGIKFITGQLRADRALKYFRRYLSAGYQYTDREGNDHAGLPAEEVENFLAAHADKPSHLPVGIDSPDLAEYLRSPAGGFNQMKLYSLREAAQTWWNQQRVAANRPKIEPQKKFKKVLGESVGRLKPPVGKRGKHS